MIPGAEYYNNQTSWTEEILNLPSPNSTYFIAFEGIDDYGRGVGVDDVTVEESPACADPTTQTETSITATSADLGWSQAGGITTWIIEWGSQGFTQGSGTTVQTTSNPHNLSGLTASTSYDWYVRAYCGAGDSSAWAGPSTFTTLCSVVSTFPATEDFENGGSIPNCWIDDPANSESWLYATSATYAASSDHTSGSGYLAWIDDSSPYNATPSNLLSPVYNTTALTAPRLVFYYWIGAGESGSTLDVDVYDGSVWQTSLLSLGTQNGWLEAILDLTAYSNANLQIRFSANEQTSDFDCDISIDDVTVEEGPTCPDPIADSTNTITLTSAHVYWTENATATKWQVEYGIAGYTPGTGTQLTPTVVGTDTTITGLTHTTAYDWYVRSICTVGDTSEWSNSASFSTLCGAIASFPFTQNFDSWTTSAPGFSCTSDGSVPLENCWENVVGDDMDWDIFTGATGSSGTGPSSDHTSGSGNYLYIESSSCNDVTAGILSPEFDFTGIYPQLSFWYHLYGDDMGTMAIQASTNGGTSWSANLWSMSGDQGDLWQQVMVNTGAYAGEPGVIFRITGTTGTDFTSDMAIDDFGITVLTDPTLSYSPDSVNYGE